MSQELEQLARVVAETIGIEGIEFDTDDSISLEFDGTLITLVVIDERLLVQAGLARLSGFSDDASFFRFLLAANDQLDVAGGNGCLAIDNTANSVELCCTIAPLCALDQATLASALARFHELIQHWGLKLNEFSLPQQGAGTAAQVPGSLV